MTVKSELYAASTTLTLVGLGTTTAMQGAAFGAAALGPTYALDEYSSYQTGNSDLDAYYSSGAGIGAMIIGAFFPGTKAILGAGVFSQTVSTAT